VADRDDLSEEGYTREEMLILATLRRSSGRTCRSCKWYSAKGQQRGCFPEGKYRKWLSPEEYSSGCDRFVSAKEKKQR
jgi:uncharacterized protein YodC (DUF2158 family)